MQKKYSNKYLIETGIGLQDVDKLQNSSYFINESERYINGDITLEELNEVVNSYYKNNPNNENRTEEADKIAIRIAEILSDDSFTFSPGQFISIHQTLFKGILEHAGELRTYNFTKNEWVLDGDSVTYADYRELEMTLQFDFEIERKFRYNSLTIDETIEHLAIFLANLWQIHAFEEGNTRTAAVFFIKYLRYLGFDVTNDTFAKNAWYFRNALVRANYINISKRIYEDHSYLVKFLRNLLLNENNELRNRDLHISAQTNNAIKTLSDKVLDLLKLNPNLKSVELANELSVSIRTIKYALEDLSKKDLIERINGKRYGYWAVKK